MSLSVTGLRRHARSQTGQRLVRYAMVSVVAVVVSQTTLIMAFGLLHWTAARSNVAGFCVGTVVSYYLNRNWAWGKRGRSHLLKEVVPFWAMAILSLLVSTVAVHFMENWVTGVTERRSLQTLAVSGASIGAFGVLWIGKFIVLNKVLFAHRPEELEDAPALDGRTGLPT